MQLLILMFFNFQPSTSSKTHFKVFTYFWKNLQNNVLSTWIGPHATHNI
jgi:hypothetical protein